MLSFSTTKPGIQTDEEENGGDESVGGTTGEATAAKRIIAKISEGLFKKEKFEHPKPSRFFIKLWVPSERRRRRRENFLKGTAATALQTERERKGHPLVVFERVEK